MSTTRRRLTATRHASFAGVAVLCVLAHGCSIYYRTAPADPRGDEVFPLTSSEAMLAAAIKADVEHLSNTIGPRALPVWSVAIRDEAEAPEILVDKGRLPGPLVEAAVWIEERLRSMGYMPGRIGYEVDSAEVWNIEVTVPGSGDSAESVVVGAHYDTVPGTPGADDNASAVAALLALASRLRDAEPSRTLRLVWFVNEELPFLRTRHMGSRVYAEWLASQGVTVSSMVCLDMLGYYDPSPGSQRFPRFVRRSLPDTGDFVGFVATRDDYRSMRRALDAFRASTRLPGEGVAIRGAARSDHWWFVEMGVPSVLITDTAEFRNPHYHRQSDTPETLDYDRLALCVVGLEGLVRYLGEGG